MKNVVRRRLQELLSDLITTKIQVKGNPNRVFTSISLKSNSAVPPPKGDNVNFSLPFLASTGALIVIMIYYISMAAAATFSDFHSVHQCN